MNDSDTLQRFIFEHASIRGAIVRIEETYQKIIEQHHYPPLINNLLAEAMLSCLLLANSIKFEGSLSLQFQGDERFSLLLVQCDHQLQLRSLARFQEGLQSADYAGAFLQGKMVLTINQYHQPRAYQSIVPLQSTSMSENLMHYFAQSEQLATRVWLAVEQKKAAGMMLQLMPGQNTEQREQFWEYAVQLGQTVSEEELLHLNNPTLLYRLYHETELRLFASKPVSFKCRCSQDKMKQILSVLGEKEVYALLQEKGEIRLSCDFCAQEYLFDSIDVALFFHK